MFAVPGGGLLEGAAGLEDGGIVSGAGDELQADGKIFVGEAAGDGKCGQAAKVANGAERIGEGEAREEIQVQGSGGDGLRSSDEHIVGLRRDR